MSKLRSIVIAGPMAVGKSTIAALVASSRGATLLAFGEIIKREARLRGLENDRGSLQDLGQEMYLSLGAQGMCASLLAGQGENVVIDGLRHIEVLRALRGQRPGLVLAYLVIDTSAVTAGNAAAAIDLLART